VNCGVGGGVAREDVVPREYLTVSFCFGWERRDRRLGYRSEASHDGDGVLEAADWNGAAEMEAEREGRAGARRGTNLWQLDLGPRTTGDVGRGDVCDGSPTRFVSVWTLKIRGPGGPSSVLARAVLGWIRTSW